MDGRHITLADLALTGVDEHGATWWVEQNELDWWDSPAPTITVTQRPRAHGGWAGDSYLSARSFSVTGYVTAPTRAGTEAALDRLAGAASLSTVRLQVAEAGRSRWAPVRRDDEITVTWLGDRTARWSTGLVAPDPRRYGTDQLTGSTGRAQWSGGVTLPLTVPFAIGSVAASTGEVTLWMAGNIDAPTTVRIDGPCRAPQVRHQQTGRTVALSASLALGADEWLLVDMDAQQVLAQGTASRAAYLTARGWSPARPGTNTWTFTTAESGPGARMTVTVRPAWL